MLIARLVPMRLLLDNADLLSIDPPPAVYQAARRARRRIYGKYVRRFRIECTATVRERLTHIAQRQEWESLQPLLADACRFAGVYAGFRVAAILHFLHIGSPHRITARMLSAVTIPASESA